MLTLHEFMAICAADGQMLRKTDGSLCTRASAVRCNQCFPDTPPEQFFMREMWMKKHLEHVDVLTTPSRYMISHYTDWGIDPSRIVHVSNGQRNYGVGTATDNEDRPRNRFGFFGQMVDNKGVWVVLQAVEHLRAEGFTDFVVELNGDNLPVCVGEAAQRDRGFPGARRREARSPSRTWCSTGPITRNSWRHGCRGWTGASCRRCGGRHSRW